MTPKMMAVSFRVILYCLNFALLSVAGLLSSCITRSEKGYDHGFSGWLLIPFVAIQAIVGVSYSVSVKTCDL
jgi:hypothetical protein